MGDIRYRIEKLLQRQEDDELVNGVVEGFEDMTIGGRCCPRQPSLPHGYSQHCCTNGRQHRGNHHGSG